MIQSDEPSTPRYWIRLPLAALCFIGFSITLPPLGLLLFLGFTGIINSRRLTSFVEWITPAQDILMTTAIVGFGLLSALMVFTKRPLLFRILSVVLLLLAIASIGGCAVGLNNLKGIGS